MKASHRNTGKNHFWQISILKDSYCPVKEILHFDRPRPEVSLAALNKGPVFIADTPEVALGVFPLLLVVEEEGDVELIQTDDVHIDLF